MNTKGFLTVLLLVVSNSFMILAWYGHLKFAEWPWFSKLGFIFHYFHQLGNSTF